MGQGATENPVPNENQGHPAWQEILSVLPESLHSVVTPKLQEWDQGVQQKLTDVRSQYDPYKELVDNNVSMDQVQQALMLALTLEQDPERVVEQAIEHFGIEKYKAQAQQQVQPPVSVPDEDEDDLDMSNMTFEQMQNNPALKPFFDKQKELEDWVNSQREAEENRTAESQLEDYLKGLHENPDYGEFNDLFVTALMSNGVSAEDAIKQYHETVNQAAQALTQAQDPNQTQQNIGSGNNQQPPVVMGSAGNVGSGLPNNEIQFGKLSNSETNDMVMKILQSQQQT